MQTSGSERGTFRNRRGKDRYRAPLVSERVQRATGMTYFEQIVASTCDYMRSTWPKELKELRWVVEDDAPLVGDEVKRYSVNRENMTITMYRRPIERLTHNHRTDSHDERMHIEHFVFHAVEELMN